MTATFGMAPGAFPELELIAELGRGAETVVYRVRRQGRDYALKMLTRSDPDGRALTAVRREAALLGCVGHPLLPQIFEVGEAEAGPYLILEYIDGYSLAQTLRAGRLDEARAVRLAIDVVGPLAAAHRAGLVHRDVKPDNVIVGTDGTARLIDFGLAARGGAPGDRVAGTLLYAAPEQSGMLKRPVDGRSDLYALGVLLFEAVTGELPYRSREAGELVRLHATAPVPDPRALRADLSAGFAAVACRLLAKDPDDRYQSGEELLADLRRLIARRGGPDVPGGDPHAPPLGPNNVLIGRDREVVDLANRWLRARSGEGGAVLVAGPAGVGKSRLVRELTTAVDTDGDLVLYGKCVPDDPMPLAPLRTAVERYLRGLDQLPSADREVAVDRVRRAVGQGGPLLRALSPLLADLVQAPDLGEKDRHEQFVSAVAAFLVDLADEWEGAVLHVDDVQWLDGSTRRVLQQVAARLAKAPLLVVATGRDDQDSRPALARFEADLGATLDTRITLEALDPESVADLVALHLGGVRIATDITDELVARVGGNPFTVVEYVRAVVDAGLITPWWGGWRLDLAGLNRLELSGDAVDLVLQRIDGLGAESRRLLAAGAATGRRFRADLVAVVCDVNPRQSRDALAEAEARRLVTASGGGGYRFLHDRIREALLADLEPAALRRLHQRIAEVLEHAGASADPRYVYATAQHYALGEADRTPHKVYESNLAAGRLALADHAPAEALEFLETAGSAARSAGISPDADYYVALGMSCTRVGRFVEAVQYLNRALEHEPDRLGRARILAQIAWVQLGAWDPGRAFETACEGLAELGRPLPRGNLGLVLTTAGRLAAGTAIGVTKIGFGRARDEERERLRLEAIFYDAAGYASTMRMHFRLRGLMAFRSVSVVNRLGRGTEYARAMAGLGLAADITRRHGLARRLFRRAAAAAADTGDPVVVAHVEWERGAGQFVGAEDGGEAWLPAITEHERWLEFGDYLTGVSGTCIQLCQDGRTREAMAWWERGKARLGTGAQAEGAGFGAVAAVVPAQLGRHDEADAGVEAMRRFLSLNPGNQTQVINLFGARMVTLVERGELGEPFERTAAEFAELGLRPKDLLPSQRVFYVYLAFGRLAQAHRASREQRAARRHEAEKAVALLGEGATTVGLKAYHRVTRADLQVLAGRPEVALRELAQADAETVCMNAPLVAYESARVRARALRAVEQPAAALHHARIALLLAVEEGWPDRTAWVREEFGLAEPNSVRSTTGRTSTSGSASGPVSGTGGSRSGSGDAAASAGTDTGPDSVPAPPAVAPPPDPDHALSRRLAALQQVSLAAATVLDPRELARVVLDETLKILGAERAFLFLVDADLDQLVPYLGRDGDGHDVDELTGYSSTLVDRVKYTAEPLVVTGSEEGVALGSRSAQIHGLRSIMIAPLLFDGRLRGVAYLDSRLAKGVFTSDDVNILTAITNHVAVSMETARAAQLAFAVQAARRQRDVAETLRASMAELSSTLDPDEVMRRLLRALTRTLAGDAAVLLSHLDGRLVVTASHGAAAIGSVLDPVPAALDGIAGPVVGTVADGQPGPFGTLLGAQLTWLALPVEPRGQPAGILLVASSRGDVVQEAQVEVAAALAYQGMTAYENARLFSQVRRLATVDGLTGLYNRAHFFTEADKQFRIAQRYGRPVAAIMVDIDHFKRINDSYGHPVGDEVIRIVAARLRGAARDSDVLGRYGGEEFALLTPETGGDAGRLAERLRSVVCGEPVPTAAGPLPVTISVGLAYLDSGEHDLVQLLGRADTALYEAKQAGRNRVATAHPARPLSS